MKQGIGVIFFLFIVCSLTSFSYAVPAEINYQGYLTDQNAVPIDGSTNLTFRLYDVDTGGTSLWDSGAVTIDVAQGVYSVVLGDTSAGSTQPAIDPAIFSGQLWLGIEVETDGEMAPRQKLTAVSYAITAATVEDGAITDAKITGPISAAKIEQGTGSTLDADLLDGEDGSYYTDWFSLTNVPVDLTDGDNDTTYTAGTGLDLTDTTFSVEVPLTLDGAPAGSATLRAYNSSNTAGSIGVFGVSTATSGATYGVYGYNASTSGAGVYGSAQSPTGPSMGVYGRSASENGYGVYGVTMNPSGTNYGVYGQSVSAGGYGLYGYASSSTGGTAGAYGLSSSNSGTGVFGLANSPTGQTRGVHGKSESASGYGVYGQATGGGTGGFFTSDSGYGLVVGNGNVGIGTTTPSEKLTVAGTIESTSGGVKFPDGSVQTSAIYGKVAVVAQSGGQYTSPLDAMNDIASWCGVPGPANPCLVKLMPGIYDLGNNGLYMQSYVDIEGSGENTTTITSTHSSSTADATSATIIGAANAEIRFLTVENKGGNDFSIAFYNYGNDSTTITHVTVNAFAGSYNTIGVYNYSAYFLTMTHMTITTSGGTNSYYSSSVYNYGQFSMTMTDMTITTTGGSYENYGIYNEYFSDPTMTNVSIDASGRGSTNNYGVYNTYSRPTMTNVAITIKTYGESDFNYGVYNIDNSYPTMTNVTMTVWGGSTNNFGVYNFATSYPTMTDVTINAGGGIGVANYNSSSTTMTDVTITLNGGNNKYGVINSTNSSLTMTNITITVFAGIGTNYGVRSSSSSSIMTDVTINVYGGADNYGVYNEYSSTTIKASSISGTTNSIYNDGSSTAQVGATMLDGAVSGAGFTCVGTYNASFIALGTNCL